MVSLNEFTRGGKVHFTSVSRCTYIQWELRSRSVEEPASSGHTLLHVDDVSPVDGKSPREAGAASLDLSEHLSTMNE